jgi:mannose-6-phosphate isomerase
MNPPLFVLDNPVQNYAWGSRTAIAAFLGREAPSDAPEAELWIGAHPKAPSRIVEPSGLGTLDRAIQDDPVSLLGAETCERFGNELPFLFKVLAAAEPLSIQAHPNQDQARRGWARENAEGIPLDAPHRNYRDPNHKPELVCALSDPFVALKGFRPVDEAARRLEAVAGPELKPEVARAARERSAPALRALFARLLTLDAEERQPVLARAAAEARRRGEDPAWAWVGRLLERYPGDAGALAPLYLNLVTLGPGDGLYLPAGELHAYLQGTALEIMANSDNVLRGGLTPKHVDAPELLATLVFEPIGPDVLGAVEVGPGERVYRTPAREFELGMVDVSSERPFRPAAGRGVEILLGLEGQPTVAAENASAVLERGVAVLVPAATPTYAIEGGGRVARARVPA